MRSDARSRLRLGRQEAQCLQLTSPDRLHITIDCGLLCNGFARLRCAQCGYEWMVAFSCICPTPGIGRESTGLGQGFAVREWQKNPSDRTPGHGPAVETDSKSGRIGRGSSGRGRCRL